MILNVRNGSAVPGLPAEAVVEVPCAVDADGAHPLVTRPLAGHQLGLVQQVKAVEQLTIQAAAAGSARMAVKALALHPLVDSVSTAQVLLEGYRSRIPSLDQVFRRS
jgi:6-phospho-beta-glucosidase